MRPATLGLGWKMFTQRQESPLYRVHLILSGPEPCSLNPLDWDSSKDWSGSYRDVSPLGAAVQVDRCGLCP